MGENEQFGFVLGGSPEAMGAGGKGSEPRPAAKKFEETLNRLLEQCGLDKLGPERAAELIFYAAEHQIVQWTELYDFFFNEAAALLLEAMEALDGREQEPDRQSAVRVHQRHSR